MKKFIYLALLMPMLAMGANVTVKFAPNGGKTSSSKMTYVVGRTYGRLPSASRSGYTFTGWYTAKSGGAKVTTGSSASKGVKKLYAHWSKNSSTGRISRAKARTMYQYYLSKARSQQLHVRAAYQNYLSAASRVGRSFSASASLARAYLVYKSAVSLYNNYLNQAQKYLRLM